MLLSFVESTSQELHSKLQQVRQQPQIRTWQCHQRKQSHETRNMWQNQQMSSYAPNWTPTEQIIHSVNWTINYCLIQFLAGWQHGEKGKGSWSLFIAVIILEYLVNGLFLSFCMLTCLLQEVEWRVFCTSASFAIVTLLCKLLIPCWWHKILGVQMNGVKSSMISLIVANFIWKCCY